MPIAIKPEDRKVLITSIRRYADENFDEPIGDLKAELLLDCCLREIGPTIYNGAIADAEAFLTDRLTDLESTCYEPEMAYWPKDRRNDPS